LILERAVKALCVRLLGACAAALVAWAGFAAYLEPASVGPLSMLLSLCS